MEVRQGPASGKGPKAVSENRAKTKPLPKHTARKAVLKTEHRSSPPRRAPPSIETACELQESDMSRSSAVSSSRRSPRHGAESRPTSRPSLNTPVRNNAPSSNGNFNAQASPRSPRAESTSTRELNRRKAAIKAFNIGDSQEMPVDTYACPQFDRSHSAGFIATTGAWDMEAAVDRPWVNNNNGGNSTSNDHSVSDNKQHNNSKKNSYITGQDGLAWDETSSYPFLSERRLSRNIVPESRCTRTLGLVVALLASGFAVGTFAVCRWWFQDDSLDSLMLPIFRHGKDTDCCQDHQAPCLACLSGMSVELFCSNLENARVPGCRNHTQAGFAVVAKRVTPEEERVRTEKRKEDLTPKCCLENDARCWACNTGETVSEYCAKRGRGDVAGCPKLQVVVKAPTTTYPVVKAPTTTRYPASCCQARTAQCEACKANIPVETYCTVLQHLHQPLPGCNGINKSCCVENNAECLACMKEQSLDVFCADREHASLDGCQGFCGLRETHTNYPGGTFQTIGDVANSDRCCDLCRREKRCTSWSWASVELECRLKRQEHVRREESKGFVSGLPFPNSLETFQIRSVSYSSMCLDTAGSLRIQDCGSDAFKSQWWTVDRLNGMLGSQRGICVPGFGRLGHVHRGPCNESWTSSWAYEFSSGLIRTSPGDHCLHAPELNRSGARVIVRPCNPEADVQRWELWTSEKAPPPGEHQLPNLIRQSRHAGADAKATVMQGTSFFCFAMVVPWGYELGLIGIQLDIRQSVFACDEAAVYSNTVVDLGGAVTSVVDADLHCKLGGIWYTALNAPMFRKLWYQVLADGHWRRHTWTVKVDADAVFMPHRLRSVVRSLSHRALTGEGVFFKNCRFGLHGPLEVVSKRSLERLEGDGPDKCSLKLASQEDAWLERCLVQLGVTELDRFDSLIAEPACKTPEWEDCSGLQTTFHPFKTADGYKKCLKQMEWVDAHPSTSTATRTATTSTASTATVTTATTSSLTNLGRPNWLDGERLSRIMP